MTPNESLAAQLARMDERFIHIARELEEAKGSRKSQYAKMEEQSLVLSSMDNRMKAVETSLATQAPTIEEFITIKHKVVGAGIAGKWIWGLAAFMVGIAFSFRAEIIRWLAKS